MPPAAWPADKVERWSVAKLLPDARNARTHSDEQIAQIAASVSEWGWTNPVLVDEAGGIIAGHARVMAARSLGLAEVPVMTARGWTDAQKRAYMVADNQLPLNAAWDEGLLRLELADLTVGGFDMSLLGFGADELAALSGSGGQAGLTDPDQVPEVPAVPVSTRGDLWGLGRHRVLCGDATSAADVGKVFGTVIPHLMVTDPPYGVNYDPDWRNRALRSDGSPSNGRAVGTVNNDHKSDWREAWTHFPGEVAYCWHAGLHASSTQLAFESCGFALRSQIIWAKQQFVIGRGHYHVQHEPCFYMVRQQGATGHWQGDRTQSTLWRIDKPVKSETGHSAQKPVECMKRPIENNSSPGQAVYDPFVGSGTTIIAAQMTGRACHALEINPAYVDVCIKRWQDFTGEYAMLIETDETFTEVETRRAARTQAEADASEAAAGQSGRAADRARSGADAIIT